MLLCLIYDKCIKTEEIFNFLGFVLFAYREIKGEKRKERKKAAFDFGFQGVILVSKNTNLVLLNMIRF